MPSCSPARRRGYSGENWLDEALDPLKGQTPTGGGHRGAPHAPRPSRSVLARGRKGPDPPRGAGQNSLMHTLAPGSPTRPPSPLLRRRIPGPLKTLAARRYSRKSASSATGFPHPLMCRIGGLRRGWSPRNGYTGALATSAPDLLFRAPHPPSNHSFRPPCSERAAPGTRFRASYRASGSEPVAPSPSRDGIVQPRASRCEPAAASQQLRAGRPVSDPARDVTQRVT